MFCISCISIISLWVVVCFYRASRVPSFKRTSKIPLPVLDSLSRTQLTSLQMSARWRFIFPLILIKAFSGAKVQHHLHHHHHQVFLWAWLHNINASWHVKVDIFTVCKSNVVPYTSMFQSKNSEMCFRLILLESCVWLGKFCNKS